MSENLKDGKYKLTTKLKGFAKNFTFEEQIDKYLYTKNKTIGFRKDKKLSKFVGLRDGYSKQLELSIISVTIDGEEKIQKKRVNFNSVSVTDGVIIHNISGTKFYNEVNTTNYKNMVEVDNPFDYMEVLYEVHIKGLNISNRLNNNKYSREDNRFIFIDNGNKEVVFIIDTPSVKDANGNIHKIVTHNLFIENGKLYYKKIITKVTDKYNFPLLIDVDIIYDIDINVPLQSGNTSGVGVISSTGTTWTDVKNGNLLTVEHSSSVGTFETAIGVSGVTTITDSGYTLNRTYLNFTTSIFSGVTDILSSVRLNLHSYIFNDEGISVLQCTATGTTISTNDWGEIGTFYVSGSTIEKNDITVFELPFSILNLDNNVDSGLTRLVLLSNHDYIGTEPYNVESYTGIDFNGTNLEVIYEYIKVYGQTELNVVKGDYFELSGYTNSGYTETDRNINRDSIMWFRNSGYTGIPISTGGTFFGYSMEYIDDNKIYAVLPLGTGWSVPLVITINVIQLDYSTLPVKNINYDEIDIDSIYFKYHRCISGVCFSYVRDINNIYEGFPLVSDSWGNESYNLYNEFDIIDEFFSNSHEVEVAYDKNLDLTKRYNEIDGVLIHEGTRVLLMAQSNVAELGVYVTQYDNTLVRINELNTYEDMFRYKAHVGAGTYYDQEIHIWPILPPPVNPYITLIPNPIIFDFGSGYSQSVTVESNTNWKLYNSIPWISVNKSKGVGITELILTTTMDNNTLTPRIGNIEFTGYGGVTTILEVIQNEDDGYFYRVLEDSDYGYTRILTTGEPRKVTDIV